MKIFDFISDIIKPAADLIDDLTTSKEEKLQLRNTLQRVQNAFNEKMLDYESRITELRQEIVKSETVGNGLQRSWRPILMLTFGFILVYQYFVAPAFSLPTADVLPADFWTLLKIGVGGYVVGRSAEKIVPQVVKNK